jgi:hypothetical protein
VQKTAKIVLTALALLPLLFVFIHPGTNPGASTVQQKAELGRLPVMVLAAALLAVLPRLVALLHWQHADFKADASAKHPLLERNCVRLC